MSVPEPPPGFCAETLFANTHWHQRWEIYRGVFTPGRNPVAMLCSAAALPTDLTGLRILDIGAWNGCFSFECERRGAREITAYSLEDPDVSGFNRLKSALGSRVRYVQGSVYELTPDRVGTLM
jgi:tRNA (mo5U34)-methyltransferase